MRKLLVTFFGLGFGPVAPATWGSLGAAAAFLAVYLAVGLPWWAIVALILLASAACVALSPWAIATWRTNDPRPMVLDEVAGMWLSLLFVPLGTGWHAAWVVFAAFALFRIFDVLKPPPARQLEGLPAGWGILCDDLAAGIMSNLVLQLGLYALANPGLNAVNGLTLGLIQGLTEFLPVSSTGHLAIAQVLMGLDEKSMLAFDVFLHLATLLAVAAFFRREVLALVRGGWFTLRPPAPGTPEHGDRKLFLFVALASVPTALIAFAIKKYVEESLGDLVAVGIFLMITGIVLFLTRRVRGEGRGFAGMTGRDALVIGVVQGVAALPGISRSGSTIASGMFLGLDAALAARFSFLISIPAILGATLLKFKDIRAEGAAATWPMALGFVAALVSGYVAIALVFRVIAKGRFAWFAPYCWAVGLAAVALGLAKAIH